MNCLGYIGDVLHSCLHCNDQIPSKRSRFYVPPTGDHQKYGDPGDDDDDDDENGEEPIYAPQHFQYASARNKAVRFRPPSTWDVVPKSCPSGHWTMRYSNPTRNNFTPWTRESPFGPFDLVPWRKHRSRVDLIQAVGWDCVHHRPSSEALRFRLPIRQSFHSRASGSKSDGGQRLVRIRVVFSFEFHKRMRLIQQQQLQQQRSRLRHRNSRVRMAGRSWVLTTNQRQVFLFDPKVFRLRADWLGYFSQRPFGVDELLARGPNGEPAETTVAVTNPAGSSPDRLDYRTLFGKISQLFFKDNGERQVFQQVPCAGCRQR